MSRAARRLAALGLGLALATAVGWALAARWLRPALPAVDREAVQELLESRAQAPPDKAGALAPAAAQPAAAATRRPEARELYLPEEVAATIFSVHATAQVYDPWCYHAHKPGLDVVVPWEEHPAGQWRFCTNAQGLREDDELSDGPWDLRILVTGDSHTEGFCDNRDSFANLLEAALRRRSGRPVDVVNAGDGAYSFHNYLGVLEKHLDLRPDVFAMCFYAGNDFVEVLPPHAWFARTALPRETEEQVAQRKLANRISGSAFVQVTRSLTWFRDHPELEQTALAAALDLCERAQAICLREGIELVVLCLPDPMAVDRQSHAELFERLERELELDSAALATNTRLGRELLARLAARGVRTLDLTAAFASGAGPYFWRKDLHLSVAGHAAVAAALEPLFADGARGLRR